jgi:hypothetical protein
MELVCRVVNKDVNINTVSEIVKKTRVVELDGMSSVETDTTNLVAAFVHARVLPIFRTGEHPVPSIITEQTIPQKILSAYKNTYNQEIINNGKIMWNDIMPTIYSIKALHSKGCHSS